MFSIAPGPDMAGLAPAKLPASKTPKAPAFAAWPGNAADLSTLLVHGLRSTVELVETRAFFGWS